MAPGTHTDRSVELPVTMDLDAGYCDPGATGRRAIEAGAVGGNLEDQMKPLDGAVAAVGAVLAAGRDAGIKFVLNARTDAFVRAPAGADRGQLLQEALRRSLPVSELQQLGVARVSTGPFTQRVALTALQDAATALFGGGAFPASTRALN